jgi:CspA family cold shock protein
MGRALKAKKLSRINARRDGSIYQLQVEDEAGKKSLFHATSDQALRLADMLDNLLADEEEQREIHQPPDKIPRNPAEGSGTVKWYNALKGFGFVTPDRGTGELFLHRSVLERAGITDLIEGTRVRFQVVEGKRGPQVSMVALL